MTTCPRTPLPDERQPPLYFAGRTNELDILKSELDALCVTGRAPGGLHLVTGVPGVGKTQLATKYMNDVAQTHIAGIDIHTLILEPNGLKSETPLFRSICEGLGEESAGVGGRVSASVDVGRHTGDLGLLLRRSLAAGLWKKKVLVIAVDELQRIDSDGIDLLAVLHMNIHNCPMQLLGFGLQHTATVLANPPGGRPGISRIRPPLTLGSLSTTDAIDAIEGNLEAMGHLANAVVSKKSVETLAQASYGFPQHIRGYLKGADSAITKHGHLQDVALQKALRHGDQSRSRYYELRLTAGRCHRPMLAIIGQMERNGSKSMAADEAEACLVEAGFDGACLQAAIEHGVLSVGAEDTVTFGIPSFHTHMVEFKARRESIKAGRATHPHQH